VTAVFGVWLVSAAMIGYFINALSFVMRALAVLAGSDCLVTQKRKTTISG